MGGEHVVSVLWCELGVVVGVESRGASVMVGVDGGEEEWLLLLCTSMDCVVCVDCYLLVFF